MAGNRGKGAALAVILAILLGALAGMMFIEYIDTPHVYYPIYDDMIADGAMTRGWIPAFVPPSAKEFEERHNIDTNTSWLRFIVPKESIPDIERTLVKVERDDLVLPRYPGGNWREAWPQELAQGGAITDRFVTYRYDYTSDVGGTTRPERDFVVIDHATGTVWHWCP